MPEYEIKGWFPVIPKGNIFPMPNVYIRPDAEFLNLAKKNNYSFLVEVKGTNTIYDGKKMIAVVNSSGYFPNYRPYFYNATGYFVLTMFSQWKGYPHPNKNGFVVIKDLPQKEHGEEKEEKEEPTCLETFEQRNCSSLSSTQINWFLFILLAIFLVFVFFSSCDERGTRGTRRTRGTRGTRRTRGTRGTRRTRGTRGM